MNKRGKILVRKYLTASFKSTMGKKGHKQLYCGIFVITFVRLWVKRNSSVLKQLNPFPMYFSTLRTWPGNGVTFLKKNNL
jgi:hypothetical protein